MTRLLKRAREEQGFTLIELMVVILIIGILVAIALPTFLGARSRAQNRAAQSSLRNALVAAKTIYTDSSSYAGAIAGVPGPPATGLYAVEPSLTYGIATAVSSGPTNVSVAPNTTVSWSAAALSASGTCYWIKDTAASGTTFGSGAAATCTGNAAAAAAAASFP